MTGDTPNTNPQPDAEIVETTMVSMTFDTPDLKKLFDVDAITEQIFDDFVEHVDYNLIVQALSENIDASSVAEHLDMDEVAGYIDLGDVSDNIDTSDLAYHLDLYEVADHLDKNDIASEIDMSELASTIDLDDDFVTHLGDYLLSQGVVLLHPETSLETTTFKSIVAMLPSLDVSALVALQDEIGAMIATARSQEGQA